MSRIIVEEYTSYDSEKRVISLLDGGFEAHTARISYNLNKGLPLVEDTDLYPLILEGTLNNSSVIVHVYSVTAGYGGSGPNAMVNILNAAGFKFENDDILTDKYADSTGYIHLIFIR